MVNPFTTVFFGLTGVWGYPMLSFLGTDLQAIKKGRGLVKFFFCLGHYHQLFLCSMAFPFVKVGWLVEQIKKKKIELKK